MPTPVSVTAPDAAKSEIIRNDVFDILSNGASDGGSGGVDATPGLGDLTTPQQNQTKDFIEAMALGMIRVLGAPLKQIVQLFNNSDATGNPASKTTGSFTTVAGSTLLVMVSGSGYHNSGSAVIGVTVKLDATTLGTCKVFTNESLSHKAFTSQFFVTLPSAGAHTIVLEKLSGTQWDANDFMNVTIAEVQV